MEQLVWDKNKVQGNFSFTGEIYADFNRYLVEETTRLGGARIVVSPTVLVVIQCAMVEEFRYQFQREATLEIGYIDNIEIRLDSYVSGEYATILNENGDTLGIITLENVT